MTSFCPYYQIYPIFAFCSLVCWSGHRMLRDDFVQFSDHRPQSDIPLRDVLLAVFAWCSFKNPSRLAFEARRGGHWERMYGIWQVSSDTRHTLDSEPCHPVSLRPLCPVA